MMPWQDHLHPVKPGVDHAHAEFCKKLAHGCGTYSHVLQHEQASPAEPNPLVVQLDDRVQQELE